MSSPSEAESASTDKTDLNAEGTGMPGRSEIIGEENIQNTESQKVKAMDLRGVFSKHL